MGNLALDPRAGLVFVDFAAGDLLHVAGRAELQWTGPDERRLRLQVGSWRLRRGAWRANP